MSMRSTLMKTTSLSVSRTAKLFSISLMAMMTVGLSAPLVGDVAFAQDEEAAPEGRQFSANSGEKVNEALQFLNEDNPQGAITN